MLGKFSSSVGLLCGSRTPSRSSHCSSARSLSLRFLHLAVCGALLLASVWGWAAPADSARDLTADLLNLAAGSKVPTDALGFVVLDPAGEVRAEHRPRELMAPASNQKLLTSMAALDTLGSDFALRTDLWRSGSIRDGVLEGDLHVVGRGDPAISGRHHDGDPMAQLRPWASLLRELGIERVRGRLLGDVRYLDGPGRHPDWDSKQFDRWYSAPSGALNLHDNCVDVHLEPGPSGIRAWIEPENPRFIIENRIKAVTQSKKHVYSVDRAPSTWNIVVKGGFLRTGKKRTAWVAVPDANQHFLGALQQLFASEGIVVEGGVGVAPLPAKATLVDRISRPLAAVLPALNKRSLNPYGDALLKILGRESRQEGNFTGGAAALRSYLERFAASTGCVVRDGSGLSRKNRVSPQLVAEALTYATRQDWFPLFRDSLAIAGVDGTLRKRFRGSSVQGDVWAKTGHVLGVSALSGYLVVDDRRFTFAFLYQGTPKRVAAARKWQQAALEKLAAAVAEAPEPVSGG